MTLRIVIGGDVCPVNRNEEPLQSGDVKGVWNDVIEIFQTADFALANLECPLVADKSPAMKSGPALCVSPSIAATLRAAGLGAMNLANNHIMDHGLVGLQTTLSACAASGVATFGAGVDIKSAFQPYIVAIAGIRIAFLGLAENERCLASSTSPGAASLNPLSITHTVKKCCCDFDYLVVLVHGGIEGYPYPSPHLRDTCHFLVELGADVVITQHSHCIGCYEKYNQGQIVYGQGNLLFDYPGHGLEGREGLLVALSIDGLSGMEIDFIPVVQHSHEIGVRKAPVEHTYRILKGFSTRSAEIARPGWVEQNWKQFCHKRLPVYTNKLLGLNRLLARFNRSGSIFRLFYSDMEILRLENLFQCEAHREVALTILEQEILRRQKNENS